VFYGHVRQQREGDGTAMDNMMFHFVAGCGHSGTTLLTAILDTHSRIMAIPWETFIFRENSPAQARAALARWYEAAAEKGADIIIEKTPRHIRFVRRIRRAFPDSQIVLMVRNPLDTVASLKARGWTFEKSLGRWISDNEKGLDAHEPHPEHVRLLNLEDLTDEPTERVRDVCGLLGIAFEPGMLDYHTVDRQWYGGGRAVDAMVLQGRERRFTQHLSERIEQIKRPIHPTVHRWPNELSAAEVAEVRRRVHDIALRLGCNNDGLVAEPAVAG